MNAAKSHAKNLQDAGYIHVQETHYKWPTNQWPKDPHFKELGLFAPSSCFSAL